MVSFLQWRYIINLPTFESNSSHLKNRPGAPKGSFIFQPFFFRVVHSLLSSFRGGLVSSSDVSSFTMFVYVLPTCTLPETNSSHQKIDGWKTSFLLGWPIFRGYVTFRQCSLTESGIKIQCLSWFWTNDDMSFTLPKKTDAKNDGKSL